MITIDNEIIKGLSKDIKEQIEEYLRGDNLTHRSFVSNILNSSGTDTNIAKAFDISIDFLNDLREEVNEIFLNREAIDEISIL